MFQLLETINHRPEPFSVYTAAELWTDSHTARQMLSYHLNEELDMSSRNRAFIERSTAWIISRFNLDDRTRVGDFGCGPGLYSSRLARSGARVTGIDFSRNSIEYARKFAADSGLDISYFCQNYLDYESNEKFDLIIMVMCDFCALNPAQRQDMLARFKRHLAPDGAILLDVYSDTAFSKRQEAAIYEKNQLNGFWSANDYYGFVNTFRYEKEKVVLDKYTLFEQERIRTVYNWLQYFTPDELAGEFSAAGLKITCFYRDVAGTRFAPEADEFAVVARLG